jgi:acetyltransferase
MSTGKSAGIHAGNPAGRAAVDLTHLLAPKSVAVIGASDQPGSLGGRAVQLLRKFQFPGPIWPVNPRRATVAELPCYPSVGDLPGTPDVVVIAVSASSVARIVEECAQAGIDSGIVWAAGFAEIGGDGIALQRELTEVCARTGFKLCGPNSIGILNSFTPFIGSFASSLVTAPRLIPGNISMVSQSGGIGTAAFSLAQREGFGFRYLVSTGNEVMLTAADFLAAFAEDPETKVIAAYLEGLSDGAPFIAAMQKARAAAKPVVVLKAGFSAASAQAATAHTGALAGEDRVWQAILREQGAITVESNRELLDVSLFLGALDRAKLPAGNRVAIIGFGGGGGVLSADLCARNGLETPAISQATKERLRTMVPAIASVANPIDLTPDMFQPEWMSCFLQALQAIADDPGIDSVFLPLSAMARGVSNVARAILDFRRDTRKTVGVSWVLAPEEGLRLLNEGGLYVFDEPARAIAALGKISRYAVMPQRDPCIKIAATAFAWEKFVPQAAPGTVISAVIPEDTCHRILAEAGLPVAAACLTTSEDEAVDAARIVGFAVAMKGISPAVTHRAAAGLVALNLQSEEQVREAYRQLTSRAASAGIPLDGLYVQHMEPGRLELLVSAFRDPVFGVMIVCGAGGNLAEILEDVTLERAPFDTARAADVLRRLRIVRGASHVDPAAEIQAAAAFVSRFSQLAVSAPWRSFVLEVNPIKWHADRAVAVDGLLVIGNPRTVSARIENDAR